MSGSTTAITTVQLAGLELFLGLSPAGLAEVAASGRRRPLSKGAVLFSQGSAAERCYALIEGRVRITQSGEEGGQLIVRFIGPGEMFGTVALFTDRRYPAEAVAVTNSIEISWTEERLLDLMRRHPQIALNIVRVVGVRLREVQERLREVATQHVDRRIAHALLRLAGHHAKQGQADATIDFPLTRKDLADMCGATLYTASRVLRAWEKAGYLTTQRKCVSIRNLAAIRRLAST